MFCSIKRKYIHINSYLKIFYHFLLKCLYQVWKVTLGHTVHEATVTQSSLVHVATVIIDHMLYVATVTLEPTLYVANHTRTYVTSIHRVLLSRFGSLLASSVVCKYCVLE